MLAIKSGTLAKQAHRPLLWVSSSVSSGRAQAGLPVPQ
jgi:hypothetical protein